MHSAKLADKLTHFKLQLCGSSSKVTRDTGKKKKTELSHFMAKTAGADFFLKEELAKDIIWLLNMSNTHALYFL